MGPGRWDTTAYNAATTYREARGIRDFEYSDSGHRVVHEKLNPAKLGAMGVRESRDSVEHPESLAIMVLLDVTGSMKHVPRIMQKKLPELLERLWDKGYATDPQILFGAIGDATCDSAPLQVGQFESNNAADEDLRNLLLEGGGGGQMQESYELALYFAARKTSTDCVEKRNKSGYLFIIGDEKAYSSVKKDEVFRIIGDKIEKDIPFEDILSEVIEKYDVYYLLPGESYYAGNNQVLEFWRKHLGQHVIQLNDLDRVCEIIATIIGQGEGRI